MNKHKIRFIAFQLFLFVLICSFSIFNTYSWVRRNYTPDIKNTKFLKMDTSGAICFILNEEEVDSISLNDYYNLNTFKLKPVSNLHGDNKAFFRLNYTTSGNFYEHLENYNHLEDSIFGLYNGFIDLKFFIMCEDEEEDIYLSNDSFLSSLNPNASEVIRIALSYKIGDNVNTILFKKESFSDGLLHSHIALDDTIENGVYKTHNKPYYVSIYDPYIGSYVNVINESVLALNSNVHLFNEYFKSTNNPLFTATINTPVEVHLLVWAEGCDDKCNEAIINDDIALYLKFEGD